jgi:hypothetical protein
MHVYVFSSIFVLFWFFILPQQRKIIFMLTERIVIDYGIDFVFAIEGYTFWYFKSPWYENQEQSAQHETKTNVNKKTTGWCTRIVLVVIMKM